MKKIAAAIAMTASLFVAIASNAEIIPKQSFYHLRLAAGRESGEYCLGIHNSGIENPEKQDTFAEQAGVAAL